MECKLNMDTSILDSGKFIHDLYQDSNQLCKIILDSLDTFESTTGQEIDSIIKLARSMKDKFFTEKN